MVIDQNLNHNRDWLDSAVMGCGLTVLPHLRQMSEQELIALLEEVDAINHKVPLANMAGQPVMVTLWDATQPIAALQVIALLVFRLWVLADEDESNADFLVKKWLQLPDIARRVPK